MNCENCGVPMRLVRDRDYWVCDYCSSLYFPQESWEGVRVLGKSSSPACPVCRTRLVSAAVNQILVFHCPKCRGILATPQDFRRIVDLHRYISRKQPHVLHPLEKHKLERRISCPHCHSPMDVHPYYRPGNTVIDSCGKRALVWLDHGEMTVIVTAPERRRNQ